MKLFQRSLLALAFTLPVASPVFAQQPSAATNYEMRLSSLEEELRTINGQVEQMTFAIRRLDQTVQRMQSDNEARLTKLETTVSTMSAVQERAASTPLQTGATEGTLGALRQRDGRVTGAVNSPQAPPLPELTKDSDDETPQEQYERAFAMLRQADYDGAEKAFQDFINDNPKDKMIDAAKYWHAETLYVRGRFSDAAVGFADAFQQNQQGPKAPDSLLKMAMSLAAINKTSDACTALAELKIKYPNASATVKNRAIEQRAKLKCSS